MHFTVHLLPHIHEKLTQRLFNVTMQPDVIQRAAVLATWSRERGGREPSVIIPENSAQIQYREIKVEGYVLQAIDPLSEDIIKADLGSSNIEVEVGIEERPLSISDLGSASDFGKLYDVEDSYNRVNYRAHVSANEVKLVDTATMDETVYSVY